MRNRFISGLAALTLLVAGSFTISPARAETDDARSAAEEAEAIAVDVDVLAQDLGISEDLAEAWVDGQQEFVDAVDYAIEYAGDQYFSSAWTPDEQELTGFKGWVSFKGEPPADVTSEFSSLPFPVEVRTDAEHSEAELEEIRQQVMSELYEAADLEGLTGDFTDDGGLEIEYEMADSESTSDSEEFEAQLKEILDAAPIEATAEEAMDIEPVEEVVRGGTTISGCTLGFTATRGRMRGAITAGHCPNRAGRPTGSNANLGFVREHIGRYGDIQLHSTTDSTRNEVRISRNGAVRKITRTGQALKGMVVCNYGRSRAFSSCTRIRNANHAFYSSNRVYVGQMVQTSGAFTNPGDSGGPWYIGNSALGIHFGKSGGYSTYTRIHSAQIALNAKVKTR
ncbi:S1 family peptidase [Actinomyces sp.]|uniref:S1 family peptidase n=1 Tax=Actinomyces sp. TaxID=29317 RepID=UPI0026DBD536|nr:S1 family peptidase [Actinomyces sp.]MDO4901364.1 S1 family peptidase [Actinomyces sp.]